jgi:hypothetical protein
MAFSCGIHSGPGRDNTDQTLRQKTLEIISDAGIGSRAQLRLQFFIQLSAGQARLEIQ